MNAWRIAGLAAGTSLAAAAALGHASCRRGMKAAETAYRALAAPAAAPEHRFDPKQVAHLPEIARRYFAHAVAPGTPLYTGAEVEMEGLFLLGDKARPQVYAMTARQVLSASGAFVWIPELRSGAMRIRGSDGLVGGEAWTRFWLQGLVPVANVDSSPDTVRSARFRAAAEAALWIPTTLLPASGAEWSQTGPDRARVVIRRFEPAIALDLTLSADGAVRAFTGQRWSNANRDSVFREQPFGGTVSGEGRFQGLTVPTRISAGNHFGTPDYLPFFQARVTKARYF